MLNGEILVGTMVVVVAGGGWWCWRESRAHQVGPLLAGKANKKCVLNAALASPVSKGGGSGIDSSLPSFILFFFFFF